MLARIFNSKNIQSDIFYCFECNYIIQILELVNEYQMIKCVYVCIGAAVLHSISHWSILFVHSRYGLAHPRGSIQIEYKQLKSVKFSTCHLHLCTAHVIIIE